MVKNRIDRVGVEDHKSSHENDYYMAYNSLGDSGDFKLTPEEFYLYSLMCVYMRNRSLIMTSISLIDSVMGNRYYQKDYDNRKEIHRLLVSLVNKKVLTIKDIDESANIDNLGTNDVVFLDINDEELSCLPDNNRRKTFKPINYRKITHKEFFQFEKHNNDLKGRQIDKRLMNFLYIYFVVSSKKEAYDISLNKFAEVIGISARTLGAYIEQMEKLGWLYIRRGDYYQEGRQESNKYQITPFDYDKKSYRDRKNESPDVVAAKEAKKAFGN